MWLKENALLIMDAFQKCMIKVAYIMLENPLPQKPSTLHAATVAPDD